MPVAFIFRIRANHEYPMLVALPLTLVGLAVVRAIVALGCRSWPPAHGRAARQGRLRRCCRSARRGLWILINPTRAAGARVARHASRSSPALLVMAGVAVALRRAVRCASPARRSGARTGQRQLGPLDIATPRRAARSTLAAQSRVLREPAAVASGAVEPRARSRSCWSQRRRLARARGRRGTADATRRGLLFALAFVAAARR